MPYESIEAAKKASFPTSAEEIDLTLAQINKLAEIYDAIKKEGKVETAFAVAWVTWKKIYKKEGDKWVEIKKTTTKAETSNNWIRIAKKGQVNAKGNRVTEEALEKYGKTLTGGRVTINHKVVIPNVQMPETRYEDPFLLMRAEDGITQLFRASDSSGWSAEFDNSQYEGNNLIGFDGGGISVLYLPHFPSCTAGMGCYEISEDGNPIMDFSTDFEGKVISAKNETEFKVIMDKLWGFFKNLTTVNNKQEVENQERNNLEEKEMEKVEELTSKLETANTELANKTSEFETATKAHEDEVKGYKDRIAEFEQKEADKTKAERDAQFEQIVAKLPPGMTHKKEDKTALRARFDSDPAALMAELVSMERKEGTGEEGSEFEQMANEYAKTNEEFENRLGGKA